MTLGELAALIDELRSTRSRTKKVARVAAFLRALAPDEVPTAIAFLAGRTFPAADPRTLDASWALLRDAAKAADASAAPSEQPALPFDMPAEPAGPLSLGEVRTAFDEVAAASGPRSKKRKVALLTALFRRTTERERELLFAIVQGGMRSGVHEGLLLEAIATASGASPDAVRRAALFLGDSAAVAERALAGDGGAEALARVQLAPFTPVSPMLASPADGVADAWEIQAGRLALETKYDGVRVQLHRAGDVVRIWSRRLTELTDSMPDGVACGRALAVESVILDGEAYGLTEQGRPLAFQDTMSAISGPGSALVFRFFDCLYRDGKPLVDEPYEKRRAELERFVPTTLLAEKVVPASAEEAAAFLDRSLAEGHEGVIAKALDGAYEPGRRGKKWLKVKLADTIDCVIIASDRGSGRREGWLSNHHLAVRDDAGGFLSVGKTFKGLTDAEHIAMTERLRALETADDGYTVTVKPEIVVEVAYDGIQTSPHLASGFALRFARIARIRDDKAARDATSLAELRERFEKQRTVRSGTVEGEDGGDA